MLTCHVFMSLCHAWLCVLHGVTDVVTCLMFMSLRHVGLQCVTVGGTCHLATSPPRMGTSAALGMRRQSPDTSPYLQPSSGTLQSWATLSPARVPAMNIFSRCRNDYAFGLLKKTILLLGMFVDTC